MSILAPLVVTGVTALAGTTEMRRYVLEWNARGFFSMSHLWKSTSILAGILGLLFGVLTYIQTSNPVTTVIVGLVAMFSTVLAMSDSILRKVPAELSNFAILIASIVMASIVLAPNKETAFSALRDPTFFPRVPTDALLPIVGFGVVLTLVGFLGFVKISSFSIATVFLCIGQIGAFLAVYAPLLWLAYTADVPSYFKESALILILPVTALGVVWFFSWAVQDKIGGADIKYMYFSAMLLPFVVGPGAALWSVMIAMIVQLFVHVIGSKLGMGELRPIRNGPIAQFMENRRAAKEGREPMKTKNSRAIAFLPSLAIVTLIVLIAY